MSRKIKNFYAWLENQRDKDVFLRHQSLIMMSHRKKRKFKKRYLAIAVLATYVIFCQSCMMMRMSTVQTKKFFDQAAIPFVDKKLDFGDHMMHYVQTGDADKPTLVFVHGSPGSWDAFKNYLKDSLLLKKYRMIAIDRPGFGYSDFGQAENISIQSHWILEFLETVDNKQPLILVGHSMGGPVIARMATLTPEKFRHLVIISGSMDPKAETAEKWRPVLMIRPFRYLIPGALRPSNDELWWLKNDLVVLENELQKITCKVTIIHGAKDRLVPFSNVGFMENGFVKAENIAVFPIPDADHFIPWTHFETIRDQLAKLD